MAGEVFISYSRVDGAYATRLCRMLEDHGLHVWLDRSIRRGSVWQREIEEKIDACSAFLVVMSYSSQESEWVRREINHAQLHLKPIYPLLLEGNHFFALNDLDAEDVRSGRLPGQKFLDDLTELTAAAKPTSLGPLPRTDDAAKPRLNQSYLVALGLAATLSLIGVIIYASAATGSFTGQPSRAPDVTVTSAAGIPTPALGVDWRNHAYRTTCDGLAESGFEETSGLRVNLSDGSATVTNPIDEDQKYFYKLRTAVAGDVTGDGQSETVVLLSCQPVGANYYMEEVQVFTSGDTLLGELPSPQSLQGDEVVAPEYVPAELRVENGKIVAAMLFYRVGASHAEGASIPRTLVWRWTGSLFERA